MNIFKKKKVIPPSAPAPAPAAVIPKMKVSHSLYISGGSCATAAESFRVSFLQGELHVSVPSPVYRSAFGAISRPQYQEVVLTREEAVTLSEKLTKALTSGGEA